MTRLVFGALALTLLAGCGIRSGLERPGPMWNSEETIARECARQRAEQANNPRVRLDPRCTQGQQSPQ